MKAGIKDVELRANGIVTPLAFEVTQEDGMRYVIVPAENLLALPDGDFKCQALLKFARSIAEELELPSRFYLEGSELCCSSLKG